jgi:hypothetical protein
MRLRLSLLAAAAIVSGVLPAAAHRATPVHRMKAVHRLDDGRQVSVPLDEVRMIAFDKPVATVYVGNPVIADITMIDARHAFVLGKAFGGTNILALDSTGLEVSNEHVTVFGGSRAGTVELQRGVNRITYACAASRCEAAPVPGDGKDIFDNALDQISKHQDLGAKAASAK